MNPIPTAFIAPAFPGILTINKNTTAAEAEHVKEKRHEAMRVYR